MYYFLWKLVTDLHNSIHFITGLNHVHKGSIRLGSAKKIGGSVWFGFCKNSWFGRFPGAIPRGRNPAWAQSRMGAIPTLPLCRLHQYES